MHNLLKEKKNILIVDDERNLAQMLSMLLETRGYEVQVAYTGCEALQLIKPDCDLIILDLVLPDTNGFDICRKLKSDEETRHIPIIILSASTGCEDKVEGLYLGADDYMSKPCEYEELVARMEAVMRRGTFDDVYRSCQRQDDIVLELRRALDQALITPFYQPIYEFCPFVYYGSEVLSRPSDNKLLVSPEAFFKAAMKYGMYTDLQILSWTIALGRIRLELGSEKIFLNCNPYLIELSDISRVRKVFEQNEIEPQSIILEITERSAVTDFKFFYRQLEKYRSLGFRFAIDDVGGGYSSLESIIETKPEIVKIDRHIVNGVSLDPFKQSIIKFIVGLCRDNNIISIAEGIETQDDYEVVVELGVDAGQGYHFFRPTTKYDKIEFSKISPSQPA